LRRGPDGQLLLVLLTGVRRAGGTAAVAVAEDVSGLIRLLSWALGGLALGGIALATVTVVVQRRVLARQLHPLWRLERDTGRLASGALEQLDNDGVPREVVPLVNAVNGMVETLSRRLSRSRRAVGDLAHALKTPLTAIGQMAGEPELRESPAVAARLRRHVDRARGIVDAQLRRARIAGGAPGGSTLLAPQVDDVLDTLRRIHAERQVAVDADVAPDLRFAGDREDVVELLGILLDNAFRWAATRVRVTARPTGEGRLELVVEDDGPGAASAAVEEMARRGRRFDESVPGSGLGLSIAAETVAEYGGRLDIQGKGELGGLRVSADLPMVAHDQSESSPSRSSPDSST
ncbi:MAG: sensor histidine kinase, partial [Ectothiorhodospiraceae bacterium]